MLYDSINANIGQVCIMFEACSPSFINSSSQMTDPSFKIHKASLICWSTPSSSIYIISDLFFLFLFIFQFASVYFISHESWQSIKLYKHLEENADDPSQDLPFSKMHFLGTSYSLLLSCSVECVRKNACFQ